MTDSAKPIRTVVVTGPECTGKTTLAAALAELFGAPWTPEASRRFAEQASEPLSVATVAPIARLAMRLEDEARAAAPALLIRDTDLASTIVYARHYYGRVEEWIVAEARARRADLYLLCAPDLPWTPDGIRDRPDRRDEMYADFGRTLAALRRPVSEIRGVGDARTLAAVASVRAFLDQAANAAATASATASATAAASAAATRLPPDPAPRRTT